MYYLRARYYFPETGRFITRDPFRGYPDQPQTLNSYAYGYDNPVKYADPTGHAAEDLQYLVPNWFDDAWREQFRNDNHRDPEAVDYVNRFVRMGLESGYHGEDIMRSVTIAIGAGLSPSGPGLWAEADYQAAMQERWNLTHTQGSCSPSVDDEINFGRNYTEYKWGNVRIVVTGEGRMGDLVMTLGGGKANATTFSANLIVFTRPLDFNEKSDMWWLEHELGHVVQAQQLGVAYLPTYILMWNLLGHSQHPMEHNADAFANAGGTGITRWD